jgi:hypothetical protein
MSDSSPVLSCLNTTYPVCPVIVYVPVPALVISPSTVGVNAMCALHSERLVNEIVPLEV